MENEKNFQFMPKKSDNREKRQEKYEYSFDEGAEEAVKRIMEFLEKQKFAMVAFHSSHINVGKTTLANRIMSELVDKGNIYATCFHGLDDITKNRLEELQEICVRYMKEKVVILIDQLEIGSSMNVKNYEKIVDFHNKNVAEIFADSGWDIRKVDLWIGLHRPDRPFNKETGRGDPAKPIADIIIRNEFAKDK